MQNEAASATAPHTGWTVWVVQEEAERCPLDVQEYAWVDLVSTHECKERSQDCSHCGCYGQSFRTRSVRRTVISALCAEDCKELSFSGHMTQSQPVCPIAHTELDTLCWSTKGFRAESEISPLSAKTKKKCERRHSDVLHSTCSQKSQQMNYLTGLCWILFNTWRCEVPVLIKVPCRGHRCHKKVVGLPITVYGIGEWN